MPDIHFAKERTALLVRGSAASGGANITLVSLTISRIDGRHGVHTCDLWLSDAASGAGLTAVTATGAIAAGASGILIGTDAVAKKYFKIQTTAEGLFILSITDTAKTPFVVCLEIEGRAVPVITLVTANYG